MTRSIFDPRGRETERSGSTFGSADARDRSKLPPDVVDGEVSDEEQLDADDVAAADAARMSVEERIEAIRGDEDQPRSADAEPPANDPDRPAGS